MTTLALMLAVGQVAQAAPDNGLGSSIVPLLVALLGGGGLGAVLAFRKTSAEAGNVAAATLIDVIDKLRSELDEKDGELIELRSRVARLESALRAAGVSIE